MRFLRGMQASKSNFRSRQNNNFVVRFKMNTMLPHQVGYHPYNSNMIRFRKAIPEDVHLFFEWANEETVRENSFNQDEIKFEDHVKWFSEKLRSPRNLILVFLDAGNVPVGQVRYSFDDKQATIGIVIAKEQRGKGYAKPMLVMADEYFHELYPSKPIYAYIKLSNQASYKSFLGAGYTFLGTMLYNNKDESYKLVKYQ